MKTEIQKNNFKTALLALAKDNADITLLCSLAKEVPYAIPALIPEIFLSSLTNLTTYNPETQRLLNDVYRIHGDASHEVSHIDQLHLIPEIKHQWLISALMIRPRQALLTHQIYPLKNALKDTICNTRAQLENLLQALISQGNEVFNNEIISLLKQGITNGNLSYAVCIDTITYLLQANHYAQVFAACDLMKCYPFIFSSVPAVSLRILMRRGGSFEPLALDTLGGWGENPLFREVILEDGWDVESKKTVLSFIMPTTELMDTLTHYLMIYPAHSTDWLNALTKGAYQGTFCSKRLIALLVQHYFEFEFITAPQLVQLVSETDQEHLLNRLKSDDSTDFEKKIKAFEALAIPDAKASIIDILVKTTDPTELRLLLEAISTLKIVEAETHIFPFFEAHSAACCATLKDIGGTKTISFVKTLLNFDAPLKETIPSFEADALALLIAICPDHQDIIHYFKKHDLPHLRLYHLALVKTQGVEEFFLKFITSDKPEDVSYGLAQLANTGTLNSLPPVIQKLLDEEVRDVVWTTAHKIVNRAYDQHQLKATASSAKTSAQVVNTALSELLLKQLERPLQYDSMVVYLRYLSEVIPAHFPIAKLAVLSTSKNPHVIKFYLSYLGKTNDLSAVKQLKNYLHPDQDIYTLRQAVLALTEMEASSVQYLIVPLLAHPNMNIKKTVAAYLLKHGTMTAVPAMFQLFAQNDNTGLRSSLEQGLKNILGTSYRFFLLNAYARCEVASQKAAIVASLVQDTTSLEFEKHCIDFPELKSHAPDQGQYLLDIPMDKYLISAWKNTRLMTQEHLERLLTDKETGGVDAILKLKENAKNVFVQDLIATKLRKSSLPISSDWYDELGIHLSTKEARLAIANTSKNNAALWGTILLDPDNEHLEWDNFRVHKNIHLKKRLFFHFLAVYGLESVIRELSKDNDTAFIRRCLTSKQVASQENIPLLTKLYLQFRQSKADKNFLAILENTLIMADHFINKAYQTTIFFSWASPEQKVVKLASYSAAQQALLKDDILSLYKYGSWKLRNELLKTIKRLPNHPKLLKLSFNDYLKGNALSFWNNGPFNTTRIKQLEAHTNGLGLMKNRAHHLQFHSDAFVLSFLQHIFLNPKEDQHLLSSFYALSSERKWNILKTELAQENWYWLPFLDDVAPINHQIKACFQKASTNGKMQLIQWLQQLKKPLYFPLLENLLLPLVKTTQEPAMIWSLLFSLNTSWEKKKEIVQVFIHQYPAYSSSVRKTILTTLANQDIPDVFIQFGILDQLKANDIAEDVLLTTLKLNVLNISKKPATTEAIRLIDHLTSLDASKANESLVDIMKTMANFGLATQMEMLDVCYSNEKLAQTVRNTIAQIFSNELLALGFLSEQHKNRFYKEINDLIKTKDLSELDKKALLKNFADVSPNESKQLLMELLFKDKKSNLDALCLRLLKRTVSKAEYLTICHELLASNKENLFPSLIRTLSFSTYKPAILDLVKLVFHKKETISKTAYKGILIIGAIAIPVLTKEMNKIRPDKRSILSNLLDHLKQEIGSN